MSKFAKSLLSLSFAMALAIPVASFNSVVQAQSMSSPGPDTGTPGTSGTPSTTGTPTNQGSPSTTNTTTPKVKKKHHHKASSSTPTPSASPMTTP